MKNKVLLYSLFLFLIGSGVLSAQPWKKVVRVHDQIVGNEQSILKKGGNQVMDYGSPIFNNPNYYYAAVKTAPANVWYRQAGLSPNGQKIVAQKSYTDGSISRTEIVLMNPDGTGEAIISTGNSGEGDIYGYMNPFWSDDGTAIGYAEVHDTTSSKIVRYVISSSTRSYIYEPVPPRDVNNADFLGSSTTTIVFWDAPPSGSGSADLYTWNGTTLAQITNTPDYKEYEPVSNAAGNKIVYWSGETVGEPTNTTHTLTNVNGVWTKDVGFTPIVDSYWPYWSSKSDNHIGVTIMSTKDVNLYDSTGIFVSDLTGPGYSGGSTQSNFFGTGFEGSNSEILMTSNASRVYPGRDIVFATPRTKLFVNDSTGSDLFPGTGHAPFATIGKAITEAIDGGTLYVAAGTYAENLTINKNLTLQGTNAIISPVTGDVVSVGASVTSLVLSGFNLIAPTGRLALKNTLGSTVDARNNLWGQITNRATITHSITGSVNFAPWTGMLPGIPSTSWPKGNTNVFELTPKLEYYLLFDVTGTPSYVTYVSPSAGTYNNLVALTTATSAQVGSGVLTGGHTYYWDVAYSIGGCYSDFSTEETFRTDNSLGGTPPVPVPCWPVNNAKVFEAHPVLEWYLVGNYAASVTYDIELKNVATQVVVFNPLGVSGSSLADTSALKGGTSYQWHIRANSTSNGSSDFSPWAYFNVDNSVVGGVPPKPVATWPTNGTDLFSTSTNLEWFLGGNFSETVNYDVVVTDVTVGSTAYSQSGISGLSANVPVLLAGHAYSWIVTVHGSSASTSSDPALFHVDATQGGNPVPHPTWPTSNASIFELKPTFEWFLLSTPASDAKFQLEVKPVSVSFTGTPDFTTTTSANTFKIPTDLSASTSYHWRVRLISTSAGNSAWSDVSVTGGSTFTTSIFATLPVPSPGSPSSGAFIASNSVSLNWYTTSTASDNLLYRVEVSSSPNMTSPVLQYDDVSDLSKVITTPHDGNYYWRVIAKDPSGEYSAYSSNGSFHTAGTTGIKNETNLIPTKFEVFQNYPNPFNPSTIIKYGLPEAANVTVKVFNMLGQEVRTLVNDYKNAGTFNVQWNGDNNSGQKVTSGIYIFRVTAGNNAATMKMILLK